MPETRRRPIIGGTWLELALAVALVGVLFLRAAGPDDTVTTDVGCHGRGGPPPAPGAPAAPDAAGGHGTNPLASIPRSPAGGGSVQVGARTGPLAVGVVDAGAAARWAAVPECAAPADGGPVAGPDCVTAEIGCGETVFGHTLGGVSRFDTRFYERNFCTPAITDHNGGDERVYLFHAPPGYTRPRFTLTTPCADLDLAVIRPYAGVTCPGDEESVADCEMWPKEGRKTEIVDVPLDEGQIVLVVVEGKDDHEGPFTLSVDCDTLP